MTFHRSLLLAGLFGSALAAQNLIQDGGFENGAFTYGCGSQGFLVSTWFQAGQTVPGADTWTTNCAQAPGLHISNYGHFLSLGAAHGGYRFSAGYGAANESFGTALASPLVAGATYTLGAWFAISAFTPGSGGYAVWLSPSQSVAGTQVGVIGANAVAGTWRCDSLQFVAPPQPGGYLVLRPLAGYIATDDWVLVSGSMYQVNQPGVASGSINGVMGSAFCPAVTTVSLASGPAVTVSLNASTYDVVYYFGPAIPAFSPPAITLPDGQVFSLNLAAVSFLCPGGPAACLSGTLTLPVTPPFAGITITAQVVAFAVGPLGVSLSQPFTLTVVP